MAQIVLVKGHTFAVDLNFAEWQRLTKQNPHRVMADEEMLQEVITKGLQMLSQHTKKG